MKRNGPSHGGSAGALGLLRLASQALLIAVLATLVAQGSITPAVAAPCPDGDGDGAVNCAGGCDPDGKLCDCDDGDPAKTPGKPELCGTGVDEDCDGSIDEGFLVVNLPVDHMDRMCENAAFNRPIGCMPGDPGGCCQTFGIFDCSPSRLSLICVLATTPGVCALAINSCDDGVTACNSDADCPDVTGVPLEHAPEGVVLVAYTWISQRVCSLR